MTKIRGVRRDSSDERSLVVVFDALPTDEDMRRIHDISEMLEAVMGAYGALWRDPVPSAPKHDARRSLLRVLSKPEQKAAIETALRRYGNPTKEEMLAHGP